jgi:hypothetical protein
VRLTYHTDPGHGWVEVPRALLFFLDIEDRVSGYSYQKGGQVFLEEDLDAALLVNALRDKGVEVSFEERYADPCFVRNLDGYRASVLVPSGRTN